MPPSSKVRRTVSRGAVTALLAALALAPWPARAGLYELSASGTIGSNDSGDASIPVGAPFSFELVYDTAAPDLDFQQVGMPDPTFGLFANTGVIPALVAFHFKAGSYEVTLADAAQFGPHSDLVVTFTAVHAIDINILAPDAFPPLAGSPVTFHADFNDFSSRPILGSDGLPTDLTLSASSFDQSTVSLFPGSAVVSSSEGLSSFAVRALPEGSSAMLGVTGLLVLAGVRALRLRGSRRESSSGSGRKMRHSGRCAWQRGSVSVWRSSSSRARPARRGSCRAT